MKNVEYNKALASLTILCCEDEDGAREQLEKYFSKRVHQIFMAENGEIGLAMYKKHNPDLVISDIKMPKLNGLDMAREIKKLNSKAQIILLTAFDYKNFIFDAIDIGVSQYVQKPIGETKLSNAIQRSMDNILAEKKILFQNQYIQNILDAQKNLVFVTDGKNYHMTNMSFLKYFSLNSLVDLYKKKSNIEELIDFSDNKNIEWLTFVSKNPGKHEVYIKNIKGKSTKFLADISPFPNMLGKFLVSLTDISLLSDTQDIYHTQESPRVEFLHEIKKLEKYYDKSYVIYIEILNVSEINKKYGYRRGELFIEKVEEILDNTSPKNAFVSNIFGFEYVVLSVFDTNDEVKNIALKIKDSIQKISPIPNNISISLTHLKNSEKRENLIKRIS